jgi:hypothetical protein
MLPHIKILDSEMHKFQIYKCKVNLHNSLQIRVLKRHVNLEHAYIFNLEHAYIFIGRSILGDSKCVVKRKWRIILSKYYFCLAWKEVVEKILHLLNL